MSRIDNGRMELFPEPTDLKKLFAEVYDIFINQMEQKGLAYTVDAEAVEHPFVECDRSRFMRILLNLVSNALKFTPSGGSVTVTMRETGFDGDKVSLELKVADTGMGMSREFAEHVFDAFERERSSTIDKIRGTGLGMAITKSFVDLMGGSIEVETEKDRGTTFTINAAFTVSSKEAVGDEGEEKEESADFRSMNLLLAEDNPINVEIATMILTEYGFTVVNAENGRVAVDMMMNADEGEFDAVLMDIRMPVMNGLEAAAGIRKLGGTKGSIPIIAMSANAFEEDVKKSLDAGMNAHIAKPIDIKITIETLKKVLSRTEK